MTIQLHGGPKDGLTLRVPDKPGVLTKLMLPRIDEETHKYALTPAGDPILDEYVRTPIPGRFDYAATH